MDHIKIALVNVGFFFSIIKGDIGIRKLFFFYKVYKGEKT